MSKHRNPVRPNVPNQPTTDNPPRRRRRGHLHPQEMLATFGRLVGENPGLAAAVLAVLEIIAGNRRGAMRIVEAVSLVVHASPERAP